MLPKVIIKCTSLCKARKQKLQHFPALWLTLEHYFSLQSTFPCHYLRKTIVNKNISTDVYQKYQKAIVTQKGVRVAAPDLRKKEQLELFRILLDDKNVVYGFTNKQIRSKMSGNPKTAKIAYELRKLRERGAIKKSKRANNYQITQEGYLWLYYSLFNQDYFVTPLLSMTIEKSKKGQSENPTSIEKAYSMINDAMKLVISELNIAA